MTYEITANRKAILHAIRVAEGTAGPNGYRTLFGGKLFDNGYADHPRVRVPFAGSTTSAAGAYQFQIGTWDSAKRALSLPDFSPASQDQAALWLIDKKRKALGYVDAGNWDAAIAALRKEWTSLPGGSQQRKTRSEFFTALQEGMTGVSSVSPSGVQLIETVTGVGGVDTRTTTDISDFAEPLDALVVPGVTNLREVLLDASVSLSTTQVSELVLTFSDPGGYLAETVTLAATAATLAGWPFRAAAMEVHPSPAGTQQLVVTFRSQLVQELRHAPYLADGEPIVVQNTSPSALLAAIAKHVVTEPTAVRPNLDVRAADTGPDQAQTNAIGESFWEAAKRWAREEGLWCFEADNTLFFGRPSWLVEHLPTLHLPWGGVPDDVLLALPSIRSTEDGSDPTVITTTVTLTLHRRTGMKCRPGWALDLSGLKRWDATYIVTGCEGSLLSLDPWTVTVESVTDPKPTGATALDEDGNPVATAGGAGTLATATLSAPTLPTSGNVGLTTAGLQPSKAPSGTGKLKPNAIALRERLLETFPNGIIDIGGYRAEGSTPNSDHPKGLALDVIVSKIGTKATGAQLDLGTQIAVWVMQQPETTYAIWWNQINSPSTHGAWEPYANHGPAANQKTVTGRHEDHVHVSVKP